MCLLRLLPKEFSGHLFRFLYTLLLKNTLTYFVAWWAGGTRRIRHPILLRQRNQLVDLILFLLRGHARFVVKCLLLLDRVVTAEHCVIFLYLWLQWTSHRAQTLHATWWLGQVLAVMERCRSTHRLRLLPNRWDGPIVWPGIRAAWNRENGWPLRYLPVESAAVSFAVLANLLDMVIEIRGHEHLTTVATLHPYSSVRHLLAILHEFEVWIRPLRFWHLQHTGLMGRLCTLLLRYTAFAVLDW